MCSSLHEHRKGIVMSKTLRESVMKKMAMEFCEAFDEAANTIGCDRAFEIVNMLTQLSLEELKLLAEACSLAYGAVDLYLNPDLSFAGVFENASPGGNCQKGSS